MVVDVGGEQGRRRASRESSACSGPGPANTLPARSSSALTRRGRLGQPLAHLREEEDESVGPGAGTTAGSSPPGSSCRRAVPRATSARASGAFHACAASGAAGTAARAARTSELGAHRVRISRGRTERASGAVLARGGALRVSSAAAAERRPAWTPPAPGRRPAPTPRPRCSRWRSGGPRPGHRGDLRSPDRPARSCSDTGPPITAYSPSSSFRRVRLAAAGRPGQRHHHRPAGAGHLRGDPDLAMRR